MDVELLELLALALAPIIFILTYVYLQDEYEREPLKYLLITFLLGILTAFPVIWLSPYLQALTGVHGNATGVGELMVYAFVVVALLEEGMKYLVLRWYIYPHSEFDEPYDGIMYGVAVSLGFAAIENVFYVLSAGEGGFETGLMRMFTAVPAHATFGVMMGYFVGKAKFLHGAGHPYIERMKGLLTAIFFHGWYDYFLFLWGGYLALFAFVALLVGLWLARRAMTLHAQISPHRDDEDPVY
jgi:RsiW-degrading membrane proteinase PrsW (M82 family)